MPRRGRVWETGRASSEPAAGARRPAAHRHGDSGAEGQTVKEACGVFGVYAPGRRRGPAHLRRHLRPPAPGPGVRRHGGQRRRDDHRGEGHGPGDHGVRRADPLRALGPPGHRPHPLLHPRLVGLDGRPARLPPRGPGRVRPRAQREPHEHRRPGPPGRDAAGHGGHRQRRAGRAAGPGAARRRPRATPRRSPGRSGRSCRAPRGRSRWCCWTPGASTGCGTPRASGRSAWGASGPPTARRAGCWPRSPRRWT